MGKLICVKCGNGCIGKYKNDKSEPLCYSCVPYGEREGYQKCKTCDSRCIGTNGGICTRCHQQKLFPTHNYCRVPIQYVEPEEYICICCMNTERRCKNKRKLKRMHSEMESEWDKLISECPELAKPNYS